MSLVMIPELAMKCIAMKQSLAMKSNYKWNEHFDNDMKCKEIFHNGTKRAMKLIEITSNEMSANDIASEWYEVGNEISNYNEIRHR